MGLESGAAYERDGDYFGPVPNRAVRIMAAASGGQILVGAGTAAAAELTGPVELVDVGDHRLKDLDRPERLFQVVVDGLQPRFPPIRAQDSYRGNLPTPAANLIGRADALAELVDLVRASRLVTLTGVGGVGKTRLALEVAAELAAELPDGVWFVELAPVAAGAAVPDAIATAMGVTPQAGVPVMHTVADVLSGRRLLLVLDNCEHVVDAAADAVEWLLARCATVRVLATSREALQVAGEQRRLVLPLTLDGEQRVAGGDVVRRTGPRPEQPHRLRRAGNRCRRHRDLPLSRRPPARDRAGGSAHDLDEPDRCAQPPRRPVPPPDRVDVDAAAPADAARRRGLVVRAAR